jgi:hypothetical protein
MQQDSFTKDVFREMDGFLVLTSVLSTLQDKSPTVAEPNTPTVQVEGHEDIHCARLVFTVLSEAMKGSPENEEFFRVSWHAISTCIHADIVVESRRLRITVVRAEELVIGPNNGG